MAVVLGAMCKLAPKLLQLLQSEYELQTNVKRKVEFVTRELESIEAALHKVAAVPWDQLDEQVKVWARQVRYASYDMEDVLDTFLLHVEGGEPVNHGWLKRAMKKMSGLVGKFKARRDITSAIDGIEKQLQEVADSRDRYKIDDIVANPAPATIVDPRLSAYYTKASQLVGIDEPRDKLIEMLSIREGDRSSNEMKIISIVGFGGLGKTTLAKAVYDKVYHQFDCGAFVPVGRNPDPKKVLRDILIDLINGEDEKPFFDQYNGRNTVPDLMPLDEWQLIIKLRKFIKGKRYCIVIDDIWDEETWEVIKNAFVDSNPRSRIIATTRNSKVSEEIGKVYRMEKLPESQSRKLLYTRTFGAEEKWPGNNDELAVVSQKILHRCDGVPLAIVTIGSLLAGKQIEEWSNVYDSVGFGHGDDRQVNNMKKILSFSYYDLPCHLRRCMLYLTVYPEGSRINNGGLIYRWIAEDLVQTEEGKEPFKVGESYFLELINRSMIQPVEDYGFLNGCRVHDMVLHMIRNLSRDENFFAVQDSKQWSQRSHVRRLALHRAEHIEVNDRDVPKLRSFNAISCVTDNIPLVSRFKMLRVLSLVGCRPLEGHLDTEYVGKLLYLRYLALADTPIRELSKEIGHLKFLQTLAFTGTGIEELPTSMKQLTKLMCLLADDKTRVPDWIGELTSLAELSMQGADGDRCLIKDLGKLRNLRTLRIGITLQDEGEVRGFLEALSNLEKIEAILVQTSKPFACKDAIMQPSYVLHCNNLHILSLSSLVFSKLPKWINPQALPKLCRLSLSLTTLYQQHVEILGNFGNLSHLSLHVSGLSSKISIVGGGRFQNLRSFRVARLCPLEFVRGAGPRLEDIWLLIPVCRIFNTSYDLGLKFGLGNISALQAVEAVLDCACCLPREVEQVEAELRHTVSIHPNRPTIQITRVCEDEMVTCSDSVVERQKKRAYRLRSQIVHLKIVYNAMNQEVLEMGDIKIDLNPSDAKNKVQGFHQLFSETYNRVQHKLLPVQEDTPIHDRDLAHHAPVEDIKAMEQALEILTVQYPRLAAMLDELRYTFSLQGAMPMPHVLNLNIRVFDIMVDKLGLDLGLLGKISSLQGIKAHVICDFCFPTEVEEVEAELRQVVEIHHPNNPPTLEIIRYAEDRMVKSDSDSQMLFERQKCKRTRLVDQVNHQIHLQNTLNNKVVEIVEQKTNTTLRDAAKHKEQRFREHFNAIKDRVAYELLRVYENIPNPDLKRLTEEIEDTERALQILTVEYPRLAAMLEELITALGLEAEDEDEVTDDKEATATSLSDRKLEDEGAVPRPRVMALYIDVDDVMENNIGLHFGLGNHRSLQGQGVKAYIDCALCFPTELESVEAELRHAIHIQQPNNPPTIEIIRFREDKMVNSDSQMLERQKRRAARLCVRIGHQQDLHNAIYSEAVEMRELITNLNLNDDIKNKNHLHPRSYEKLSVAATRGSHLSVRSMETEQRFLEHFNAIKDRVEHELLQVYENIPNPDLKRVVEDIKAMEQALEILTVEYPRLAAMLDELRYRFSLQGAMPMPHVLNLNIRVFDIMVDKLGLDLGLLGKISSLQGIKAHVICQFCFPTEVEKVEAELRQAVDMHHPNNPPTLEIIRYAEDRMVNSDSDSQMSLRRQILRRTRLVDRVNHQKHLYNTLNNKVVEIVEQKTNTTLSDAAKHKEQRFHENLNAVKDRVEHELLRVNENIPNRDLKRVTDEIEDMERALQILTVEYPRQAAMLEQLKTALGLEAEDEDEDEVTDDKETSATSLSKEVVFAASVSETNGEEVSAASLPGREEEKKRRRRPWQSPYPTEKRRMR